MLAKLKTMSDTELQQAFSEAVTEVREDGISFSNLLQTIMADKTEQLSKLKGHFDRLFNTNIELKGSPINVQVDISSGRFEHESLMFFMFLYETVFTRLPLMNR